MNIGVLGTGQVGRTLAGRLVRSGHAVILGSRDATNEVATEWAAHAGPLGRAGAFADAAAHGEIVINATRGDASLSALEMAGAENLAGKVVVDVSNPIEPHDGGIKLTIVNTDSLAEQIQRAFPDARVVKTLNTVNAAVMVDPAAVPGDHTVFLAGDDDRAKNVVRGLLDQLGWRDSSVLDLGGLSAARGMEMYLPLWLAIAGRLGTMAFNVNVVRGD